MPTFRPLQSRATTSYCWATRLISLVAHWATTTFQSNLASLDWPISLICPAAKVLESLFLPTINKYLIPAQDQHSFRREHSTTSALLQLTTDVAVGFNQRKPPDQTVCVAVDLSALFDTVCHSNLLSKINRSQLPPAIAQWLSCYLRGRQAKTCFRGVMPTSRKVNTGVPQGSKLSQSLLLLSTHNHCSAFTLLTCRYQQNQ